MRSGMWKRRYILGIYSGEIRKGRKKTINNTTEDWEAVDDHDGTALQYEICG